MQPKLIDAIKYTMENVSDRLKWLTGGPTTLLYFKNDSKITKNDQSITCLWKIYKLITLLLTNKLYIHVTTISIMLHEQNRCRSVASGCKDNLLIDQAIMEDDKHYIKHCSFMWIDYQKAYNHIPHP